MFPFLLIEDDEHCKTSLCTCLETYEARKNVKAPAITWKQNFFDGLREIQRGIYPIVIVDFQIPSGQKLHSGEFADLGFNPGTMSQVELGIKLLSKVKEYNASAIVVAHTGGERLASNVNKYYGLADFLLQKEGLSNRFAEKWTPIEREVRNRFNYDCDQAVIDDAISTTFLGQIPTDSKNGQWEICLRRALSGKETDGIVYQAFTGGKSGAGVVSAQFKDRRPVVLKFGPATELAEEFRNYQLHVRDYIARNAITDRDSFYCAGAFGILQYRLAGTELKPLTLSNMVRQNIREPGGAIRDFLIADLKSQIEDHFVDNCRYWFEGSEPSRGTDIYTSLRKHFNLDSDRFRQSLDNLKKTPAFSAVINYLGTDYEAFSSVLVTAVECKRNSISFRRPYVRVHGDLNCNNLVWDGGNLCMIDFAKTTDEMPITTDFVKLEASLKFDIAVDVSIALEEYIENVNAAEEKLLKQLLPASPIVQVSDTVLHRRFEAILAVRTAANRVCSRTTFEMATGYFLSLFVVTAKHLDYLSRDVEGAKTARIAPCVAHALISIYRLSDRLTDTEGTE